MKRWNNLGVWAVAALCITGAITGGGLLAKVTNTLDEQPGEDALVVQVPLANPLPPRLPLPTPPLESRDGNQTRRPVTSQDLLPVQEGKPAKTTTVQVVRPGSIQLTEQGQVRDSVAPTYTGILPGGLSTSGSFLPYAPANPALNSLNQAKLALKNASKDEDKKKAEEQLQKALNDYFDQDLVRRKKELIEIKKKVEEIEKQIQKRENAKGDIIDLQKKVIVNEVNDLGFFGTPASTPAGGFFSTWTLNNSNFGTQTEYSTPEGKRLITVPATAAPAMLPGLPSLPPVPSTPAPNPGIPSAETPATVPGLPTIPAALPAPIVPRSTAPATEPLPPPPQLIQISHKGKIKTPSFSLPSGWAELAIHHWESTVS